MACAHDYEISASAIISNYSPLNVVNNKNRVIRYPEMIRHMKISPFKEVIINPIEISFVTNDNKEIVKYYYNSQYCCIKVYNYSLNCIEENKMKLNNKYSSSLRSNIQEKKSYTWKIPLNKIIIDGLLKIRNATKASRYAQPYYGTLAISKHYYEVCNISGLFYHLELSVYVYKGVIYFGLYVYCCGGNNPNTRSKVVYVYINCNQTKVKSQVRKIKIGSPQYSIGNRHANGIYDIITLKELLDYNKSITYPLLIECHFIMDDCYM